MFSIGPFCKLLCEHYNKINTCKQNTQLLRYFITYFIKYIVILGVALCFDLYVVI